MNEQNAKRANELLAEGVEPYSLGDDECEPLDPGLSVEVVTAKAVLFRIGEGVPEDNANAELDDGEPGVWFPKSVLRVDTPEVMVKRKFVDDKNLWDFIE